MLSENKDRDDNATITRVSAFNKAPLPPGVPSAVFLPIFFNTASERITTDIIDRQMSGTEPWDALL